MVLALLQPGSSSSSGGTGAPGPCSRLSASKPAHAPASRRWRRSRRTVRIPRCRGARRARGCGCGSNTAPKRRRGRSAQSFAARSSGKRGQRSAARDPASLSVRSLTRLRGTRRRLRNRQPSCCSTLTESSEWACASHGKALRRAPSSPGASEPGPAGLALPPPVAGSGVVRGGALPVLLPLAAGVGGTAVVGRPPPRGASVPSAAAAGGAPSLVPLGVGVSAAGDIPWLLLPPCPPRPPPLPPPPLPPPLPLPPAGVAGAGGPSVLPPPLPLPRAAVAGADVLPVVPLPLPPPRPLPLAGVAGARGSSALPAPRSVTLGPATAAGGAAPCPAATQVPIAAAAAAAEP